MSDLAFLEKLLDGTRVEWVPLREIASVGTGSSNRQDESDGGPYPFYVRSKHVLRSDTFEFDETAIVIPGEGGIGDIYHFVNGKYALHQRAYRIAPQLSSVNPKYLFYWMSQNFKQYIIIKMVGSTADSIRKPMLDGFECAIPSPDDPEKSLAIQGEIVRILDRFTELNAELTAELEARKKQYNHYRDRILTFEDGEVEWKPLGDEYFFEIANRGRRPVKASLRQPGKTPYYGANNIQDYVEGYTHEGEYVLIAEDGSASLENYSIQYAMGRFWANNHVHVVRGKSRVNTRYLFHLLNVTNFQPFLSGGGRAKLTKGRLVEISIPIPCPDDLERSLAIQEKIVQALDKFDTLTTSLSEGLPREIEMRQKQYEYYRDLLLSFPKPAEGAEA